MQADELRPDFTKEWRLHRGLVWAFEPDHLVYALFARYAGLIRERWYLIRFLSESPLPPMESIWLECVEDAWKEQALAVDKIPFEIHRIVDFNAYTTAVNVYLDETYVNRPVISPSTLL